MVPKYICYAQAGVHLGIYCRGGGGGGGELSEKVVAYDARYTCIHFFHSVILRGARGGGGAQSSGGGGGGGGELSLRGGGGGGGGGVEGSGGGGGELSLCPPCMILPEMLKQCYNGMNLNGDSLSSQRETYPQHVAQQWQIYRFYHMMPSSSTRDRAARS